MVNSSAIFSHSQCQWENLVGFIRSFIPTNELACKSDTACYFTNWTISVSRKCTYKSIWSSSRPTRELYPPQSDQSILALATQVCFHVYTPIWIHSRCFTTNSMEKQNNFFSYFYSSRRQTCFLMCANGGELIICLFLRGNQLWDCFEWSTDRWWRIQSWWWKTSFAFCSLTSQPPPWCILPKYICSNCKLVYIQSFS